MIDHCIIYYNVAVFKFRLRKKLVFSANPESSPDDYMVMAILGDSGRLTVF